MSRGHVAGTLQTGVQPLQAFPTGQSLNGYAEHVYEQPEGEPPVETNSIRAWRDWPGLRNGQTELRLNNQRAPRVHGLGWGFDADANVWRPTAVDGSGRGISSAYSYGYDPTTGTWIPVLVDPTGRVEANSHGYGFDPDAGVWRPLRVDSTGAVVTSGTGPSPAGPPTAQLSAWYRAGDINQAGGSTVYTWADRSGNGADLVPVPGINQPTLATNVAAFNSQSAVVFNGFQQLGRLLPPGLVGGDSAFSLYAVCQPAATGSITCFSWGQPDLASKRVALFFHTPGANRLFTISDLTATGCPNYLATSDAQIVSSYSAHGGNMADVELLRNDAIPSAPQSTGVGGPLAITIPVPEVRMGGAAGSSNVGFSGQIAEVLLYHKKHNSTERDETINYLSQRYAIPV